jgi:membrane-bound lytic murein transglycosylase B
MKTTFLLFIILLVGFAPLARAQYPVSVVADPIAVENEVQQIAKWTESIGVLNQQLQQLQQSLQVAQTVKGYIGDPRRVSEHRRFHPHRIYRQRRWHGRGVDAAHSAARHRHRLA